MPTKAKIVIAKKDTKFSDRAMSLYREYGGKNEFVRNVFGWTFDPTDQILVRVVEELGVNVCDFSSPVKVIEVEKNRAFTIIIDHGDPALFYRDTSPWWTVYG
jgi:hypothetical protein